MADTSFNAKIKQRELIKDVLSHVQTGSAISATQILNQVNEICKNESLKIPNISHPTVEKILQKEFVPSHYVNMQNVQYGSKQMCLYTPNKEELSKIKTFKVTSKGIEIEEK